MTVTLHGYRYSVYHRIARLALEESGVRYDVVPVDPFDPDLPAAYLALHPFGRVPVLVEDGFTLYETAAITRYVDRFHAGGALVPEDPRAAARMQQVISVVDSYGYWPLVRQVFAHGVFRPLMGEPADSGMLADGLSASGRVLDALEAIAAEGSVLAGAPDRGPTLADLHLAPMADYFLRQSDARALWDARPALTAWWQGFQGRESMRTTDPGLPSPAGG